MIPSTKHSKSLQNLRILVVNVTERRTIVRVFSSSIGLEMFWGGNEGALVFRFED